MLDAAYKLNFISYDQMIVDFLTLLFHEINHILQFRYRDIICDDITKILNISYHLKLSSFSKIKKIHDLFPDEIDSNIRASKVVYDTIGNEISEQNLIYFLKLSILYNDKIIYSPLEFLYNDILGIHIDETFKNVNSIYYGLRKTQGLVDAIIDSYQTHELCVDIDGERRLKKCHK